MSESVSRIPQAFVWRRLHSLMGLWLVFYLIIHLLANSQAALLIGENGSGFVNAVKDIHNLPYLPVLEIILLAIPFGVHIIWGIKYLWTGEFNSYRTDGSKPSLPQYPRNHAYTWQRITSWILLVLIAAHVVHMRFMEAPAYAYKGSHTDYMVRVNADPGIYTLSKRLGVTLYNPQKVEEEKKRLTTLSESQNKSDTPEALIQAQKIEQEREWIKALEKRPIHEGQVIAVAKDFGTAELLMVRETFKIPVMLLLYTVLVISACFHGFNGLWTFMITWGVTLSAAAQNFMRKISTFLMLLIAFLGLAAIWGTYWINLKQ
jgi:succinate dehydrogenase / fumarate reductase, cytochrome b subunit